LPKNTTFILNLPKTLIIKPVLLIFSTAAIPASALTSILTSALTSIFASALTTIPTFAPTFIILIVSALVPAELTLSLIPKITVLSLITCILTEPQVQP
jgi:hypothetical protein